MLIHEFGLTMRSDGTTAEAIRIFKVSLNVGIGLCLSTGLMNAVSSEPDARYLTCTDFGGWGATIQANQGRSGGGF